MAKNNIIEENPANMLFFKSRKVFQISETLAPFYKSQIEQIGTAKIIILVDKTDYSLTSPNNKELLTKMQNAMETLGSETFVIELSSEFSLSWSQLKKETGIRFIISFGVNFSDIEIQANSFNNSVIPFDSSYFLLSNKLSDFHDNAELKNLIWKKMKKLIELSNR